VHNILPIIFRVLYNNLCNKIFILKENPMFIVEVRFGLWMAHLRQQGCGEMNPMSS